MFRLHHVGIKQECDFLTGVIGKAHHHVPCAQIGPFGKPRERAHGALTFAGVGALNDGDAIGVNGAQHIGNGLGLRTAADLVTGGGGVIQTQVIALVKERLEPFDIIRAQAHDRGLAPCR